MTLQELAPAGADPLTGLATRAAVRPRLEAALEDGGPAGVVVLDLDRFKDINDVFGDDAGDAVLRAVAERLRAALPAGEPPARSGGDQFVVICPAVDGERGALEVAERLRAVLAAPILHGDRALAVAASVGVALADDPGRSADAALRDAHIALRRAKDAGGGRCELFDVRMRDRIVRRVALEHDLRDAVARGALAVEYQPLARTGGDGGLAGVEALLRWDHPRLGRVAPATLVAVAERAGLTAALADHLLGAAARRLAAWEAVGTVWIALPGAQLRRRELPDVVAAVLAVAGAPAERLGLELAERGVDDDQRSAVAVLRRLKALGVRLALDDFGGGRSSLDDLRSLPIDEVHVAASFVADLGTRPADRHILGTIVHMATGLGVTVTAKGVETADQAHWVAELGCAAFQGHHVAPAGPAAAIEALLAAPVAPASAESPADTVSLGTAAQALGVSTSTLRRWADAGRIAAVRTEGGHRRFAVAEVQRLTGAAAARAGATPRPTPLPEEPLPALAAVLERDGAVLTAAAARAIYVAERPGWLATPDAEPYLERWVRVAASAARDGRYSRALGATETLMEHARYAGVSLLERQLLLERCGELVLRRLQAAAAPRAELIGTRRLFAHLRQLLAQDC